ncbi:hypothetical protein JCM11641_002272 [Rhodosporidiobolus odoratus]
MPASPSPAPSLPPIVTTVSTAAAGLPLPARHEQQVQGVGGRWRPSFTQGILLGQASMVILAVLFLRYVVFEDPETGRVNNGERRKRRRDQAREDGARSRRSLGHTRTKTGPVSDSDPSASAALLAALSYDLAAHPLESLDWINVLLAQLISSYRSLANIHPGGARALFEAALNGRAGDGTGGQGIVALDFIEVEDVELGKCYPALSAARVRPSGTDGEGLRVELDLDYQDCVALAVSTRVVVNVPRPRFAVLPVSLSLSLERFSGTLSIELPQPTVPLRPDPSPSDTRTHLPHPMVHFSLHPDFELDLRTTSLLGSRAKLQDVPKIEQLVVARVRAAIQDRVVWPGRVEIALPGLGPPTSSPSEPSRAACNPPDSSMSASATPPTRPSPSTSTLRPALCTRSSSDSACHRPETPTVDLADPDGPSLSLHPHLRRPAPTSAVYPSSPTESLPGYFPSSRGRGGSGVPDRPEGIERQTGPGLRYRGSLFAMTN